MIENTRTIKQSSDRLNILVHGPHGTCVEVRESYTPIINAYDYRGSIEVTPGHRGTKRWRVNGRVTRVTTPTRDHYDPAAMNCIHQHSAFVAYTDWEAIAQAIAEIREDWGNIPVQINA